MRQSVSGIPGLEIEVQGTILTLWYKDRRAQTLSLALLGILGDDAQSLYSSEKPATDQAEAASIHAKVCEFIDTYNRVSRKYSGRVVQYKKDAGGKWWQHFVKATETALRLEVSFDEFLAKLIVKYTELQKHFEGSEGTCIPYPNQLHGETAETYVVRALAAGSGSVPTEVKVQRMVNSKRNVPIQQDEHYAAIRERIKVKTHTREDLEYVKARHQQVAGSVKPWVLDLERELNEREKGTDGT